MTGAVKISNGRVAFPQAIKNFAKKNTVMLIAMAAAAVTCLIVPPDGEYLGYFDIKTLTCLFCVLAVVSALKDISFFYLLAKEIVRRFKTTRQAILVLLCITFIGSMLIANDMALLTFLPLGYLVLSVTGKERYMAFTFIMQNIAANLGGMLTPFGNPQNLYLYTAFEIPTGTFISIMAPPFILAVVMIVLCCLLVKNEPISMEDEPLTLPAGRTALYMGLFALSIAIVFRGIPFWVGLIVIPAVLFFADRRALSQVDYPLLMTFVFFFIFSGNMARIDIVSRFFSALMEKSTLIFSELCCQFISNVPSAILLSRFTDNYPELLVGVNIGGTGTIIASLASLITLREYLSHNPCGGKRYMAMFSGFNFSFLAVLTVFEMVIL